MSDSFNRARLLRDRSRHEEAVAMLLAHLAQQPEDPLAFAELAMNRMEIPGQMNQALADARTLAGLMPGEAFVLALQARILCRLDRYKEALSLSDSALALDPESDSAWNAKCLALIGLSRWPEAEECARAALALDADDEIASNLLAHVLRMQNRLAESEGESQRRLARDPENAFSFANAGWAALQRGDIAAAESHFRESLRIDPEMEYAKEGLKQAYRARSGFFRVFLKWSFFMQRFSEGNRMAIIIGLIVGFKLLKALAASVHPLWVIPVAVVYYLFVFGSWISNGIAHFLLLRDPVARLSLDRAEKIEGAAIGALFFGGLAALTAGFGFKIYPLAVAGGVLMITTLPATMVFTNPSRKGQIVFAAISLAILGLGVVMAVDVANHPGRQILEGTAAACSSWVILLGVGSTWLTMLPMMRRSTPE
jgi:tetratricopeptide (TPR) repeat protein